MPSSQYTRNVVDIFPITTLASASYTINSGTLIAGGTQTAEASAFSDTVTVTGVRPTDKNLAICPRDAVAIPADLALISVTCSANDAVVITWKNNSLSAISPPAAGVWSLAILGGFIR